MFTYRLFRCFLVLMFLYFGTLHSMVYTVVNTNDEGEGSLRQAIVNANNNAGKDTIDFNIPTEDSQFNEIYWRIAPLTELPVLSDDSTEIWGGSQASNQSNKNSTGPEILIDGSECEPNSKGIYVNANHVLIEGLVISGFSQFGIELQGNQNIVQGCYIGMMPSGSDTLSNQMGIYIHDGQLNKIGGNNSEESNIISGNQEHGLYIENANHTLIQGNFIGTDYTGLIKFPNYESGICLVESKQCQIGSSDFDSRNVISGNYVYGIKLDSDSDSSLVQNNMIGLNILGNDSIGNGRHGVYSFHSSHHQILHNIISANGSDGIHCTSSDSVVLKGNIIGTDITQTVSLGNQDDGIELSRNTNYFLIGGLDPEDANIISGNARVGIDIAAGSTSQCEYNQIIGNYIGSTSDIEKNMGNQGGGIRVTGYSRYNRIGPQNTIAYNKGDAIYASGDDSQFNTITQNAIFKNNIGIYIYGSANEGVDAPEITGKGSVIGNSFPNAFIEIFSDSLDQGRWYEGSCIADEDGNFVYEGNPRGPVVTATATTSLGSTSKFSNPFPYGPIVVSVTNDDGEGSLRWALQLANETEGSDSIHFNIPILDDGFDGTVWIIRPQSTLPYLRDTGTVLDGSTQTINQGDTNPEGPEIMIDGSEAGLYVNGLTVWGSNHVISGFILSGFDGSGIFLHRLTTYNIQIYGNYIGTTASGNDTLPNEIGITISDANQNIIGSSVPGLGNIISGNRSAGLDIGGSDSNHVIGNKIGTNKNGTQILGNGGSGIYISNSRFNYIGGSEPGAGNLISGNEADGIRFRHDCYLNRVYGNRIGTDNAGSKALPNSTNGIQVFESDYTLIGGTEPGEGNLISGNGLNGIVIRSESNLSAIKGNYIGTDITGMIEIPNVSDGIDAHQCKHTQIGPGNIVSGNQNNGIALTQTETDSNQIVGNWIGLNATGQDTLPNDNSGIYFSNGVMHNEIGGESVIDRNIISGNRRNGIYFDYQLCAHNKVLNNYIGTDTSGTIPLGNQESGIYINASEDNYIGPDNRICYNDQYGIEIAEPEAISTTISENAIFENGEGGIFFSEGVNDSIVPPEITSISPVSGTALPNGIVEIYSDSTNQGRIFEVSVIADASGNFTWAGRPFGPFITATVTDDSGNTSIFSDAVSLTPTDVQPLPAAEIREFALYQNHPNPFNPVTTITYDLAHSSHVQLIVYNMLGREVYSKDMGSQNIGQHQVEWNGTNSAGYKVSSGIYFYQIKMTSQDSKKVQFQSIRKMVLMK